MYTTGGRTAVRERGQEGRPTPTYYYHINEPGASSAMAAATAMATGTATGTAWSLVHAHIVGMRLVHTAHAAPQQRCVAIHGITFPSAGLAA